MKTKPSSIFMLLLTAMIWGLAFSAQIVGSKHIGMFTFNGFRFLVGAVFLIPVTFIFGKNSKKADKITILSGIVSGFIVFSASTLQFWGIYLTKNSAKGGFITSLYTIIVPVFAYIFLKKRTGKNVWIGAVLSLVGLFLILSGNMNGTESIKSVFSTAINFSINGKSFSGGFSLSFGDFILILGSFGFAAHIVFIDRFCGSVSALKFSCTQFFTAGAISMTLAIFLEKISASGIEKALPYILYLGIMSTGIAYTLQIIGQKRTHPTVSAIILSTESMFAAIGGALLLRERLPVVAYVGCGIILAGIIIAQFSSRK